MAYLPRTLYRSRCTSVSRRGRGRCSGPSSDVTAPMWGTHSYSGKWLFSLLLIWVFEARDSRLPFRALKNTVHNDSMCLENAWRLPTEHLLAAQTGIFGPKSTRSVTSRSATWRSLRHCMSLQCFRFTLLGLRAQPLQAVWGKSWKPLFINFRGLPSDGSSQRCRISFDCQSISISFDSGVRKWVVSKRVVLADAPLYPKPERGYKKRMTVRNTGMTVQKTKRWNQKPERGYTFAEPALLQNHRCVSSRSISFNQFLNQHVWDPLTNWGWGTTICTLEPDNVGHCCYDILEGAHPIPFLLIDWFSLLSCWSTQAHAGRPAPARWSPELTVCSFLLSLPLCVCIYMYMYMYVHIYI